MTRQERDAKLKEWWTNLHPTNTETKPVVPDGFKVLPRRDGKSFTVFQRKHENVWYPTNMKFWKEPEAIKFAKAIAAHSG